MIASVLANLILTERLSKGLILPAIQNEEYPKIRTVGLGILDMVIEKIGAGFKSVKTEQRKQAIFKMMDRMPDPKILLAVWNLETGIITDENKDLSNLNTVLKITSFLLKSFRKKYTTKLDVAAMISSVTEIEVEGGLNISKILEQLNSLSEEQGVEHEATKLNESKVEQAESLLEFWTPDEVQWQWKVLKGKCQESLKEKTPNTPIKVMKHLTDFLTQLTKSLSKASKDQEEEKKLEEICDFSFDKALAKDAHTILEGR